MAWDVLGTALQFMQDYGLVAVFVLLFLDAAMLLPIVSGELILVAVVTEYAHDVPSLIGIIALASAADLLGNLLLYGAARIGGRPLIERFPRLFMMPRRRRERMARAFARKEGALLVLVLRLLPVARVLINIPAGLAKMRVAPFTILTAIGTTIYHAAVMWFIYEVGRPGSGVSQQADTAQRLYGDPAWQFIQANTILVGAAVVAVGVLLSVRASIRRMRDPDEVGSVVGWFATLSLFWGGIALATATYVDAQAVFRLIQIGGIDIQAFALTTPWTASQIIWAVSAVSILVGTGTRRLRRAARERQAVERRLERLRRKAARQEHGSTVAFIGVDGPDRDEEE